MGCLLSCCAARPGEPPLYAAARTALRVQLWAECGGAAMVAVWALRWPNRRERGGLAAAAAWAVAATDGAALFACAAALRRRGPPLPRARAAATAAGLAVASASLVAAALGENADGRGERATTGALLRVALLVQLGLGLARAACADLLYKLHAAPAHADAFDGLFSPPPPRRPAAARVRPAALAAPADRPRRPPRRPPPAAIDVAEECAICLQRVAADETRLPCAHLFHEACIADWLSRTGTCPICRLAVAVGDRPGA